MIKLSENRPALINLGITIAALDGIDRLIKHYSMDVPSPAYCVFTQVDGPGEVKVQIERSIALNALQQQREKLVQELAHLGIEA